MLQMELLWNLQIIDKDINKITKELKDKKVYNLLSGIKVDYNLVKETLVKDTKIETENSNRISELNMNLAKLDEKLKDFDKKLYEEDVDIKLIDNIQKEIEVSKKSVDEIENDLLTLIEENEKNIGYSVEKKGKLLQLKTQFETLKKTYSDNIQNNRKDLENLNKRRKNIIKEIDMNLLEEYNNIASKKNTSVSKVTDSICTECGVKLNALLYDTLKKRNEICICDYCGRLLYID